MCGANARSSTGKAAQAQPVGEPCVQLAELGLAVAEADPEDARGALRAEAAGLSQAERERADAGSGISPDAPQLGQALLRLLAQEGERDMQHGRVDPAVGSVVRLLPAAQRGLDGSRQLDGEEEPKAVVSHPSSVGGRLRTEDRGLTTSVREIPLLDVPGLTRGRGRGTEVLQVG